MYFTSKSSKPLSYCKVSSYHYSQFFSFLQKDFTIQIFSVYIQPESIEKSVNVVISPFREIEVRSGTSKNTKYDRQYVDQILKFAQKISGQNL